MEVILSSHTSDFHSKSPTSSPQLLKEYYFSAPTSPSHLSKFYTDFDQFLLAANRGGCGATVPFSWEERPGVPKRSSHKNTTEDDFAFDVSEEWETGSQLSADELFDGGLIKPFNPPPPQSFTKSAKNRIHGAFSPRGKTSKARAVDPAASSAAATETRRGRSESAAVNPRKSSGRRAARSLSPIRDGEYQYWEDDDKQRQSCHNPDAKNPSNSSMIWSSKGSKKWRLKDFFLFRSASEGRAAEKDHLKKYTAASYRHSSFRAIDVPGPRKGTVSAHELHYTVNRAVSQDLKKKTFLPYKQGILGRLAFNPAVHAVANGFGYSHK